MAAAFAAGAVLSAPAVLPIKAAFRGSDRAPVHAKAAAVKEPAKRDPQRRQEQSTYDTMQMVPKLTGPEVLYAKRDGHQMLQTSNGYDVVLLVAGQITKNGQKINFGLFDVYNPSGALVYHAVPVQEGAIQPFGFAQTSVGEAGSTMVLYLSKTMPKSDAAVVQVAFVTYDIRPGAIATVANSGVPCTVAQISMGLCE
ncbi:MAG: hypothetical protein KGI00_03935 [Candidatus Micrarchaeota archaeon]|nr:hypothetical protein [Candidatus Micrarchaeota archaeon]